MYAVYIKNRREPIVIEDLIGRALKEQFDAGILDSTVALPGFSFDKFQIRYIEANYHSPNHDYRRKQMAIETDDIVAHRKALEKYKQKKINGEFRSRFEQYMHECGIVGYGDNGEMVIKDAIGYTRFNEINERANNYDTAQLAQSGELQTGKSILLKKFRPSFVNERITK